jgi:hypothetical protein
VWPAARRSLTAAVVAVCQVSSPPREVALRLAKRDGGEGQGGRAFHRTRAGRRCRGERVPPFCERGCADDIRQGAIEDGNPVPLPALRTGVQTTAKSATKSGCGPNLCRAITHALPAQGDRTDAGHNLAFRQMSVANQPRATVDSLSARVLSKTAITGLGPGRQQRPRSIAQNLSQRMDKGPGWMSTKSWCSHGASRVRWRSGRLGTPPRHAALPGYAATNFRP